MAVAGQPAGHHAGGAGRIAAPQPRRSAGKAGVGASRPRSWCRCRCRPCNPPYNPPHNPPHNRPRQRRGGSGRGGVSGPGAGPRARRSGVRCDRQRCDPVGRACVLQAGGRRLRDPLAPGRPLLADPPAGHLHNVYMVHGAAANTSAQRRTGVALRYMPASSHFDRSLRPVQGQSGVAVDFAQRPLWLLKGVDRSGRNDFTTGHPR